MCRSGGNNYLDQNHYLIISNKSMNKRTQEKSSI